MDSETQGKQSLWRRVVLFLLTPIVFVITCLVMALILIPIAIWNGLLWCFFWMRLKLLGMSIPPKCPIPDTEALLICFRDKGSAHDDMFLWLEGYSRTMDSYYLMLDRKMLPEIESADKVRHVLISLLEHWIEAIDQATSTRPAYLPYDFSDQSTGCLQCRPEGDMLEIIPGFSLWEGWKVVPSNPGEYFFGICDFQQIGPKTIRLAKKDFLNRIRTSIVYADIQS